jgi:predicted  nucleic acid-binding Zn-ribbon protein
MAGTGEKKTRKGTGGDNYVVLGRDGKLYVASGKTGKVELLKKEHQDQIESLIKQRQALGLKLSKILDDQGYVVAACHPTNVIEPGKDD